MRIIGVIPSRYASSRFPGKPLALIKGKPLIRRVWERAKMAKHLDDVIIATDDERISSAARSFGAKVEMTSARCASGTDRVAEVAARYPDAAAFVNIQGDEPLISPLTIDGVASVFLKDKDGSVECATAVFPTTKIASPEIENASTAKVITDRNGFALYFSRALIPAPAAHASLKSGVIYLKHIGIYGYRRNFLVEKIKSLEPCPMESIEQLEQLRFLYNGIKIRCVNASSDSFGVDTPGDIVKIEKLLSENND